MKSDGSLFDMGSYEVCSLSPKDIPALDALCHRCFDYYVMVTGSPPGPDAGYDLYFDLPTGKEEKDKILLGFFNIEGKMLGILDMIRDYPAKNINFIGLMMIDPAERRKGLGEMIIDRLSEWLKPSGTYELQLGVVRQNTRALNFWKKVGFVEIGEKRMEITSQKFLNIIKMKMIINPDIKQKNSADHHSVF